MLDWVADRLSLPGVIAFVLLILFSIVAVLLSVMELFRLLFNAEDADSLAAFVGLVLIYPVLMPLALATFLVNEYLWAIFGIYRAFGVEGRPVRAHLKRMAKWDL